MVRIVILFFIYFFFFYGDSSKLSPVKEHMLSKVTVGSHPRCRGSVTDPCDHVKARTWGHGLIRLRHLSFPIRKLLANNHRPMVYVTLLSCATLILCAPLGVLMVTDRRLLTIFIRRRICTKIYFECKQVRLQMTFICLFVSVNSCHNKVQCRVTQ